jgi:hypothetical protein
VIGGGGYRAMEGGLRGRTGATIHVGEVDLSVPGMLLSFFPVFTTSSRSECEFYHAEKFTEFDILNCNSILFCACYKHKLEKQSKNQLHKNCLITKEIDYNSRG